MNYYNEYDPKATAWIRQLIIDGIIPYGHVDDRSITEVNPSDLEGYTQCHFFAGIGGWSKALQLAEYGADQRVWTASLPCQPFSTAGKRLGQGDERHLWPVFFELVKEQRPERIFGEQVAQAIGFDWLDGISADLESEGYEVGSCVLGAHSIGLPHIRQRLYWVASRMGNTEHDGHAADTLGRSVAASEGEGGLLQPEGSSSDERLAGSESERRCGWNTIRENRSSEESGGSSETDQRIPDPSSEGFQGGIGNRATGKERTPERYTSECSSYNVILCRDGKTRRIEPSIHPLVDGLPRGMVYGSDPCTPEYANQTGEARNMRLKGYGNAIVPPLAAEFIIAYTESINQPC